MPSPSIDRGDWRGDDEELRERRAKRSSIHPSIHHLIIMEEEYGESVAWREWASRSVGENKVVNSMLIVEKPSQGTANSLTRQDARTRVWAKLGIWATKGKGPKDREVVALLKAIDKNGVHRGVLRVEETPYLTTHVAEDEYVLRSLAEAGQGDTNKGIVIRTNQTHVVVSSYRGLDDSRPAALSHKFAHDFLQNAQRAVVDLT